MRIIAGRYARRTLTAPPGLATRPTADRAREAIFNIIAHQDWGRELLDGVAVLDACCGTGALGLEALSRGAAQVWFLEQDSAACAAVKQNITALAAQGACHVLRADAAQPPRATLPCHLVFLDPPYRQNLPARIVPALQAAGWFAPEALLVLETARDETAALSPQFVPHSRRDYGAAAVTFYRYFPDAAAAT